MSEERKRMAQKKQLKTPTDKQRIDWIQEHCGNIAGMCDKDSSHQDFSVCSYRWGAWTIGHKSVRDAIDEAMQALK